MRWIFAIAAALLGAQPVAAQQSIEAPGTVSHNAAMTGFAERVGEFRRVNVLRYDTVGRDISANYDLVRPEGRVRASVYIYPAVVSGALPAAQAARIRICRDEFAGVEAAIVEHYKDAALLERTGAPALAGVEARYSHRSVHRFRIDLGGGEEEVRSESRLYCFVGGNWLVKYRISASAGLDAGREIEAFIRDGAWPGRAAGPQNIVIGPAPSAVAP